jgi:hypothetical protein
MLRLHCWPSVLISIVAVHASGFAAVAATSQPSVPAGFRLVVGHSRGFPIAVDARGRFIREQVSGWTINIDSNGASRIKIDRLEAPSTVRRYTLSRGVLRQILKAINDVEYFELPRAMVGAADHGASYFTAVTMHGRTHKVRVYSPWEFRHQMRLRRFREVWAEAVKSCPHVPKDDALAHLDSNI